MMINVNGRITGGQDAVISVLDHGFLYGEGVYETMRTRDGRVSLYTRHMRRMRRSARMMALDLPFSDDGLAAQIEETIAAANLPGAAHIRVLVTRGAGELTYDPAATPTPSVVIIVKPHVDLPPDVYQHGVRVVIVDIVRNHPASVSPMIKSNNLMNSALAMQEAIRRGAFEGLMRNYRGELAEFTTSNIFIVKNGVALTPPLDAGILPGVTREVLLEAGRGAGIDVLERALTDDDLFQADEAFLTGTTRGVVPIVTVDDRSIGTGRPGPVTRRLGELLERVASHA
jgi:branched-chain amino acid aminotransferase